ANPLYSNQRDYLPFLFSAAGMQPVVVAVGCLGLLELAQTVTQSIGSPRLITFTTMVTGWATPNKIWYWLAASIIIMLYTYLFNFHLLRPYKKSEIQISDQMKRTGIFVVGKRPGKATQEYLEQIMWRL